MSALAHGTTMPMVVRRVLQRELEHKQRTFNNLEQDIVDAKTRLAEMVNQRGDLMADIVVLQEALKDLGGEAA